MPGTEEEVGRYCVEMAELVGCSWIMKLVIAVDSGGRVSASWWRTMIVKYTDEAK